MKDNKTDIIWVKGAKWRQVRVSELSLNDDFLKYSPKTPDEKALKKAVEKVIKDGVRDFKRPTFDPSFDGDGRICYQAGMMPAVGQSCNWWAENAKKSGYRLGTYSEYIAFLAVLIKEMVESGKFSLEEAWHAVCNDSKELGHYCNSSDTNHTLEATGNRKVCGWRDLVNTCKILAEDKEAGGFWLAGGEYYYDSNDCPLASMYHVDTCDFDIKCFSGTGWLVLS